MRAKDMERELEGIGIDINNLENTNMSNFLKKANSNLIEINKRYNFNKKLKTRAKTKQAKLSRKINRKK